MHQLSLHPARSRGNFQIGRDEISRSGGSERHHCNHNAADPNLASALSSSSHRRMRRRQDAKLSPHRPHRQNWSPRRTLSPEMGFFIWVTGGSHLAASPSGSGAENRAFAGDSGLAIGLLCAAVPAASPRRRAGQPHSAPQIGPFAGAPRLRERGHEHDRPRGYSDGAIGQQKRAPTPTDTIPAEPALH